MKFRILLAVMAGMLAGAVQLDVAGAAPARAGVLDCQPGGTGIRPWEHISTGGVTRGAGTTCGYVALSNNWAAYGWDEAADGACIYVVYDGNFNGTAGPYTQIPGTYACGSGVVNWQVWGIAAAEYVRVVVDWGGGTTSSKQIYP